MRLIYQKRKQSGTDDVGTREIWGGPSSSTSGGSAAGTDTSASAAVATQVQTTPVPEALSVPSEGRDETVGTANDDSDTPSATQLIPVRDLSSGLSMFAHQCGTVDSVHAQRDYASGSSPWTLVVTSARNASSSSGSTRPRRSRGLSWSRASSCWIRARAERMMKSWAM